MLGNENCGHWLLATFTCEVRIRLLLISLRKFQQFVHFLLFASKQFESGGGGESGRGMANLGGSREGKGGAGSSCLGLSFQGHARARKEIRI